MKILTNSYHIPAEKPDGIDTEQFDILTLMCDEIPEKRPDISDVLNMF